MTQKLYPVPVIRLLPLHPGQLFTTSTQYPDLAANLGSLHTLSHVVGRRLSRAEVAAVAVTSPGGQVCILAPDVNGKLLTLACSISEGWLRRQGYVPGTVPGVFTRGRVTIRAIASREFQVGAARHGAGRIPLWRINEQERWVTAAVVAELPGWFFS